ncbi:fumarylacetoacetase [Aquimarina megaterium]|uniref:fumarylacetoacetase n=1 Tax=Aquimarina megaterium TaxID=1443666 RepID=UPI0009445E56|nr:fumarylacetoacetase [Aquimarina megaterium]
MRNKDSWVHIKSDSDFSIHNIPFGIFSTDNKSPRIGIAIGDEIVDLLEVWELGLFKPLLIPKEVFKNQFLNDFIALGKEKTNKVRVLIQKELLNTNSLLREKPTLLVKQENAMMYMPVFVRDYTDFYSSIEHATNVGKMFRDPENALLPNWKHIPVGYHGRASSIVVSGTNIHRPMGQILLPDSKNPVYSESKKIDFELEMGFIIGKNTSLGDTIKIDEAKEYIFGKVLFNDWSARDVQKWEYIPLGPFLSKNFASSISPWVVTMEALEPFRIAGPEQTPEVLPYLKYKGEKNYDIKLQVLLKPENKEEKIISNSNFKYMYWNMAQQISHHTMNGCNLSVGDMMGSGTISGKSPDSYGSMLELTWSGQKPLQLSEGVQRTFIEDHDTIIIKGYCEKEGVKVGFGVVKTKLLPSIK